MYQEETTFTLRFHVEAQFPEEYDGDEDAHAWVHDWDTLIKPAIIQSVFNALRNVPAWSAHVRNRGLSTTDEVEIALTKVFADREKQNEP